MSGNSSVSDEEIFRTKPRLNIKGRRPSKNVDVVIGEEAVAERLHLKFASKCVFDLRQRLREFGDETKFNIDQMIVGVAAPEFVRNPAIAPRTMTKFVECLGETHQQFIREEDRPGPQRRLLQDALRRLRDFHKRQMELAEANPDPLPGAPKKESNPLLRSFEMWLPREQNSARGTQ